MSLIINSVFSLDEVSELLSIIKKEKESRDYNSTVHNDGILAPFEDGSFIGVDPGRETLELFPLPEKIINKISSLISKDSGYSYVGTTYCEYNLKHGNPQLPMHFDGNKNNVCFDYQLESNTEWPIIVDNEEYILKNNDALLFDPGYKLHGRPNKTFIDDDYVNMFFVFWRKHE